MVAHEILIPQYGIQEISSELPSESPVCLDHHWVYLHSSWWHQMPEKGQKHSSEAEEKGKASSQGNENYSFFW